VLETHIVGTRQRIILLRAKDREVLIGMTVNQITTLATWPADDTPPKKTAFGSADTPPPSVKSVTSVTHGAGLRQLLSKLQGRK
jgi:flagellar biogenesis protein FliO